MVRKALEVLTAVALFAVFGIVTYYAWTQSGASPPVPHSAPDVELQASPPSDSSDGGGRSVDGDRPVKEDGAAPSPQAPRLAGLDAPPPKPLAALLDRWETPVLQAHVATSMEHAATAQQDNITLTAERLAGTVLRPGEAFSFIYRLGPFDSAHGYGCGRTFVGDRIVASVGGGVCQVASTLYNAVVSAGLKVLERHPHSLTVPYLPPGRDATISSSSDKDFRFQNDAPAPVVIWATTAGESLHVWIFGRNAPPAVEWRHERRDRTPFRTVRQPDPSLPAGEVKVESPGQPGVTVHSVIVITRYGKSTTYDLGTARYLPSPRVVRVGAD